MQFLDPEIVEMDKKKILDPEIVEMMQFLDPEIAKIPQFLDPEIVNMDKKIYGSRNRSKGRQILYAFMREVESPPPKSCLATMIFHLLL